MFSIPALNPSKLPSSITRSHTPRLIAPQAQPHRAPATYPIQPQTPTLGLSLLRRNLLLLEVVGHFRGGRRTAFPAEKSPSAVGRGQQEGGGGGRRRVEAGALEAAQWGRLWKGRRGRVRGERVLRGVFAIRGARGQETGGGEAVAAFAEGGAGGYFGGGAGRGAEARVFVVIGWLRGVAAAAK